MADRSKTLLETTVPPPPKDRHALSGKIWERPEFPPRRAWPRIPFSVQEQILAFLGDWREHADAALAKAQTILAMAPDLPGAVGQVQHWAKMISAIDWLASHVGDRQRHLAVAKFIQRHPEFDQCPSSPDR